MLQYREVLALLIVVLVLVTIVDSLGARLRQSLNEKAAPRRRHPLGPPRSARVLAQAKFAHRRQRHPRFMAATTLLRHATDANALMVFMPDRIDAKLLDACPDLKVVGAALKGFDNLDIDACTQRNVRVTFVPELLTVPAAELTIGMMIALARHVIAGDARVRKAGYRGWRPILYGRGLAGETVGFLGMGVIGQSIAERLQGFGVKLLCHDARKLDAQRMKALNAKQVSIQQVMAQSTYVIVALPLNAHTIHAVNASTLKQMKPGAFLINIGRGSVVEEEAVASALRSGRLGGYAADVFEFEDLSRADRPRSIPRTLLSAPNTLFLPASRLGRRKRAPRHRAQRRAQHRGRATWPAPGHLRKSVGLAWDMR